MMRAWRPTRRGTLAALELPLPEPTADRALVRIEAFAIGDDELAATDPERTPGGAAVGTVVATGDEAGHVMGQRVLIGPHAPCGECDRCRRGAAAVCAQGSVLGRDVDGTMASHVVAAARWLCPLGDGLLVPGAAAAAAARELACAYSMYARTGIAPGEPVIIAGGGVMDRFLIEIGLAMGTRPLAIAAPDQPAWRAFIEARGLPLIGDEGDGGEELATAMRAAAAAHGLGARPWRVLDGEGSPRSRRRALALAEPATTLTMTASRHAAHAPVDLERLIERGCTVIGVAGAHPDLMSEAAALAAKGEVVLDDAVCAIAPTDVEARFAALCDAAPQPRLTVVAMPSQ
jgi:L-iditol 2-dehydrogenase